MMNNNYFCCESHSKNFWDLRTKSIADFRIRRLSNQIFCAGIFNLTLRHEVELFHGISHCSACVEFRKDKKPFFLVSFSVPSFQALTTLSICRMKHSHRLVALGRIVLSQTFIFLGLRNVLNNGSFQITENQHSNFQECQLAPTATRQICTLKNKLQSNRSTDPTNETFYSATQKLIPLPPPSSALERGKGWTSPFSNSK